MINKIHRGVSRPGGLGRVYCFLVPPLFSLARSLLVAPCSFAFRARRPRISPEFVPEGVSQPVLQPNFVNVFHEYSEPVERLPFSFLDSFFLHVPLFFNQFLVPCFTRK